MELTNKDIQLFYTCCHVTAKSRIDEIKKALRLPKHRKRILINHLAKYEGLTIDECKQVLRLYTMPKTG